MTTAKEMMHPGVECVPDHETLDRAAQLMRDLQVGSLPICGSDDKLKGILTDRDIVVRCVAMGKDPSKMTAAELAQGKPVFVDADASEDDVIKIMERNAIRRVPVIEDHQLVGMISEADLAQHLSDNKLAHFVSTIAKAPPTPASTSTATSTATARATAGGRSGTRTATGSGRKSK
jgi:CBS domain-containing protein